MNKAVSYNSQINSSSSSSSSFGFYAQYMFVNN